MKTTLKLSTFLFLGLFGLMANAVTINVSEIRITPSTLNVDGWLQVTEVVAIETGTGNDLALTSAGATATGSSNFPIGTSPDFAIDGIQASPFPEMFHSNENDLSSFLSITLAAPSTLDSVTIIHRTNDCCFHRDFYNLSLFDSNGSLLYSENDLDGTNGRITTNLNANAAAVPIPAAIWLFGTAILGLIGMKRRKS